MRATVGSNYRDFLLRVGDGRLPYDLDIGANSVQLPNNVLQSADSSPDDLIRFVYGDVVAASRAALEASDEALAYLAERALLAPHNEAVTGSTMLSSRYSVLKTSFLCRVAQKSLAETPKTLQHILRTICIHWTLQAFRLERCNCAPEPSLFCCATSITRLDFAMAPGPLSLYLMLALRVGSEFCWKIQLGSVGWKAAATPRTSSTAKCFSAHELDALRKFFQAALVSP